MKKIYSLMLLLGVLACTAATVKAGQPVNKPDSAIKTTGARIAPLSGGTWNYTNQQLCAAAQAAIPSLTFTLVELQTRANTPHLDPDVYWLHFFGVDASGKGANIYIHLELNGDWYEIPNVGGHAYSCIGSCQYTDHDDNETHNDVCKNTSPLVMVRCECVHVIMSDWPSSATDCSFVQYPTATQTIYENLELIHD